MISQNMDLTLSDLNVGWADPYNAATLPIEYLERLQDFFGGDVSDFINVFMVPGK